MKVKKIFKKTTKVAAAGYVVIAGIALTQLVARKISQATVEVAMRILEAE